MHSPFSLRSFRRGRAFAACLGLGAATFAAALHCRSAEAHSTGLSQGDFVLGAGGHVDATLVFAGPDATVLARRAGEEAPPDLNDAALHGIEVRADAEPCRPSYRGERAVGGDAVEVRAAYDCPHRPRELTVSLPLLDELPPSHVHLVRISSGDHESQAVLRSSAASATLRLAPPREASRITLLATIFAVLVAGATLAWLRRLRRRT